MAQEFIPDSQFVPDEPVSPSVEKSTQVNTSPQSTAADFVPDSEFVSDEDKYGTPGQQAIAGLEGAARGLTFGGSDVLESTLLNNPEAIKGRAEANPVTSTLTQIGGAALPIIATGGAATPEELAAQAATKATAKAAAAGLAPEVMSDLAAQAAATALHGAEGTLPTLSRYSLPYAVSRLGKGIEAATGEGLTGRLLGMGAEGALYGAGNVVSDAALGDPHLTAQKVLSDVGMGAAFGSGLGLLSKGVEAVLPKAAKKLSDSLGDLRETVFGTNETPSLVTKAMSIPGSIVTGSSPSDWAQGFLTGLSRVDRPLTIRTLVRTLGGIYDAADQAASDLYETAAPANISKALETMPVEQARSTARSVVNDITQKTLATSPELDALNQKFQLASADDFIAERAKNKRGAFLSPKTPEELKDHKIFMTADGVGYSLSPEGDLQNVFNNSGRKGAGQEAIIHAISQGAKTLDAFDGYLPYYYNDFGFNFTKALKWDDKYAPVGWDYAKYGRPDVILMEYPESLSRDPREVAARFESSRAERAGGAPDIPGQSGNSGVSKSHVFTDWPKGGGVGPGTPGAPSEPTSPDRGNVTAFSSPQIEKTVSDRVNKLRQQVEYARSADSIHKALSDFAKDLDRNGLIKFDTLPTASQIADQQVLKGIRGLIRGNLKDESIWGEAAQHYSQAADEYSAYQKATKNFQQAFMKKDPGTKKYFVDPGKVQTFFNRFNDVGQDVRKQYLNDFINRAQSLSKASENYYGYQAAEGSLSDRVSELAKKNEELTQIAQALKSRIGAKSGSGRLGELGLGYIAHSIGVPNPVLGAALGAFEAYKAVKNPYELGSNLANTLSKLRVLGDIVEGANKRISTLSKSIFIAPEGRALPAASFALTANQTYDKKVKRVEELASDPQVLMDHLDKSTRALHDAAPNVSEGLQTSMISAVQFLNSKVPRSTNEMVLSPDWEPSRVQKEKFLRYYDTVDDPTSVLKEIKNGTLTNESMEALHAVHPRLLAEMQKSVLEHLDPRKARDLNYSTKISLSKFLGEPLDEAMLPHVMASNQAALAGAGGPPPAPMPAKKSSLGGLKQLTLSSRRATQTQEDRDNET